MGHSGRGMFQRVPPLCVTGARSAPENPVSFESPVTFARSLPAEPSEESIRDRLR